MCLWGIYTDVSLQFSSSCHCTRHPQIILIQQLSPHTHPEISFINGDNNNKYQHLPCRKEIIMQSFLVITPFHTDPLKRHAYQQCPHPKQSLKRRRKVRKTIQSCPTENTIKHH
ncbi:hypothetical protein EYC84_010227 [Monilinia fructicola]|uniref:Uncharacterized protein n=1 Tax=Monilinia fructicola TaxID=38448 RepID=A0A5M9JEI2_MONFR|nr:hypothetical protein EYC84_010227 [Monilinia fructicola]